MIASRPMGSLNGATSTVSAMAAGTLAGGWRIVHTMGKRLTRLKPRTGFCAETGAAISILFPTFLGLPVSTTHAIAGAIAGSESVSQALDGVCRSP